jgi:hypothetical protein
MGYAYASRREGSPFTVLWRKSNKDTKNCGFGDAREMSGLIGDLYAIQENTPQNTDFRNFDVLL